MGTAAWDSRSSLSLAPRRLRRRSASRIYLVASNPRRDIFPARARHLLAPQRRPEILGFTSIGRYADGENILTMLSAVGAGQCTWAARLHPGAITRSWNSRELRLSSEPRGPLGRLRSRRVDQVIDSDPEHSGLTTRLVGWGSGQLWPKMAVESFMYGRARRRAVTRLSSDGAERTSVACTGCSISVGQCAHPRHNPEGGLALGLYTSSANGLSKRTTCTCLWLTRLRALRGHMPCRARCAADWK